MVTKRKATGRNKGQAFERFICKELSLWLSKGVSDDHFWRTAASGGRATRRGAKGQGCENAAGDVCATTPEGAAFLKVFALELKNGYSARTLHDLLDIPPKAKQQVYEDWFQQAEASQKQAKSLYWMLITKRNQRVPLVLIPWNAYIDVSLSSKTLHEQTHLRVSIGTRSVACFVLSTFLLCLDPAKVIQLGVK